MKYLFVIIIGLLFLSCTSSVDFEIADLETEEINCDTICRAVILEGHLQENRNNFAALDSNKDSLLVKRYIQERDSIYTLIGDLDLKNKGIRSYDDNYRNQCLECWADQLGANLSDMAKAAAYGENIERFPTSWLPYSLESVKTFQYNYNNKGEPYFMFMGNRIIVMDTIQHKMAYNDSLSNNLKNKHNIRLK